jgi:hypothetical protein
MFAEKYWLVSELTSGEYYHYTGYYKTGKPVFTIAIADAVQIASFQSAKTIYNILSAILPCEIWLYEHQNRTKVYPIIDDKKASNPVL